MPFLNAEERKNFLEERGILMRVSCARPNGSPLVAPVWFICKENSVYFTPRAESEWFDCLRKDPRVALCIDEDRLPYRKIIVEGLAELRYDLGDDHKWQDLYLEMAERYIDRQSARDYVDNTMDQQRALLCVSLADANLKSWRMPLANEAETGIWHKRYYAPGTKYGEK